MQPEQGEEPKVETLTASLLYLMSHYMRSGCPRLALCVSRHMQCLAVHPDTPPVVRDICAGLHGAWTAAAAPGLPPGKAAIH